MARVDSDGYYYIVDRKKDLIIRGGYNVYPREIEEVLHEHPAVAEVAVIGLPHAELGEEVGAAVALKPGATATPEELRAFARDKVAAYKYPRQIWLVDALPKGPTGKILRREVQPRRRPVDRAEGAGRPSWAQDAVDAAGGLDLLLTDAALGVMRRLRPDSSLLRLAAGLARRPRLVGREATRLGTELGRIAAGRSAIAPEMGTGPRDRRFADPAWTGHPLLRRSVQAYLAAAQSAEALVAGAELGWRDDTRLKFLLANLIAAAAPSNNPLLSPAAWKALIDTGGGSAVRGLRALATDLAAPPRVPSMVAADAFEVGRDLAVTPGGVVYACEQFELIQYQPTTDSVYRYPLLIVPPMINKYYIVDLAPGRSLVEFLVGQGHQVFVVSWRNPDARHRDWGLDTYGGAIVAALDAVRAISGAAKASLLALCSGGIAAAMVAAHLSVTGRLGELASLGLGVAVLDHGPPGGLGGSSPRAMPRRGGLGGSSPRAMPRRGGLGGSSPRASRAPAPPERSSTRRRPPRRRRYRPRAATWTGGGWPRCSRGCGPTT